MFIFLLTSSAMIVCAMSFDRFMAILYPLRYNNIRKKYRANITLALIWTTAAFVSSLPLMGLGSSILYYPGSWCFLNFVSTSTVDRINSIIYSLLGLMILFSTIFFNGSVIFFARIKSKVVIFGNATKLIIEDDSVDLLAVRLSISNSVVDPWIYILLRREHLIAIKRKFENTFGKISFAASSRHDAIPSTDARQKSLENTMSSGKTLSTDNLTK
uniref:Prostacyclin receptor n=1 Tax=Magallana gigas TaxID=29159 RepID=K1R346_MAGGI